MNRNVIAYRDLEFYEEGLKNIGYEITSHSLDGRVLVLRKHFRYENFFVNSALVKGIEDYGGVALQEDTFCFKGNPDDCDFPIIYVDYDERLFLGCLEFLDSNGNLMNLASRKNLELAYDSAWTYFRERKLF